MEYVPWRGSSLAAHIDDSWIWGARIAILSLLSHSTLGRQAELKRLFRQSHVARGPNRKTLSILVRNGKLVQETLEHDLRNIMGKEATISKKRAVQRHVPRCTSELKRKR